MEQNFNFEIVSPEKIIFSSEASMVKLPSYEGDMSILQNHIPIITFLRPGIIKVEKNNAKLEEFFVQDGTIEFFNNNLVVLSTSVLSVKDISKEFLDDLNQETSKKLESQDISDQDRYILNQKLDILKDIRI